MENFLEQVTYCLAIETTRILNNKQKELSEILWQKGEANLDIGFSKLACISCLEAWQIIKLRENLNNVNLECDCPDINLTFIDHYNRKRISKIELKSSKQKNKKIPGSTIRDLNINQPLIYCLRPKNPKDIYQVRCSQYHHAMGKSDIELFQDRSPRPYINFDKMAEIKPYKTLEKNDWIKHYSKCALNRLEKNINKSWQDNLVQNIKDMTILNFIKTTSIEEFIKLKNNN